VLLIFTVHFVFLRLDLRSGFQFGPELIFLRSKFWSCFSCRWFQSRLGTEFTDHEWVSAREQAVTLVDFLGPHLSTGFRSLFFKPPDLCPWNRSIPPRCRLESPVRLWTDPLVCKIFFVGLSLSTAPADIPRSVSTPELVRSSFCWIESLAASVPACSRSSHRRQRFFPSAVLVLQRELLSGYCCRL
jgi:hypothetical protein